MAREFEPGAAVWFRQDVRGGYDYDHDIPAEVVTETPHRLTIRLLLKGGDSKVVHVKANRVRPRETPR